ncbi:hypothetical protein [Xanthomonas euroxanthea]|uniref:hypothetical protein n=1 Tax=Xanthomonas euroxanthea TaxID=2259622 RepID=UPI0014300F09|nr:hypothetical protein [Xanthomonas euroxanthea]
MHATLGDGTTMGFLQGNQALAAQVSSNHCHLRACVFYFQAHCNVVECLRKARVSDSPGRW